MDAGELGSRNMSVTWLEVPAGAEQTLRSDEEAEQVYVVVRGAGTMSVAGDTQQVGEGDLILVPPATDHSIANDGEEAISPASRSSRRRSRPRSCTATSSPRSPATTTKTRRARVAARRCTSVTGRRGDELARGARHACAAAGHDQGMPDLSRPRSSSTARSPSRCCWSGRGRSGPRAAERRLRRGGRGRRRAPAADFSVERRAGDLVVDVAGAVAAPGRLPAAGREPGDDAVSGPAGRARRRELEAINLRRAARRRAAGRRARARAGGRRRGTAGGAEEGPISLGTATVEQLDTIDGIGPVTAADIIEFRDQHGGLASVDQLDQISGIGPATMESLRARLQP